jgi:hypothetical protein
MMMPFHWGAAILQNWSNPECPLPEETRDADQEQTGRNAW